MPLTDTMIKNLKPQEKPYKKYDKDGLLILINPNGSKYFRKKYRVNGKEKTLAIGVYPEVSLKEAREKNIEATRQINNGIDPSAVKKEIKAVEVALTENTFEFVSREWHEKKKPGWSKKHGHTIIRRLERFLFPDLGDRDIASITAPELLATLRKLEDAEIIETAHRVKQISGQVFRYAVGVGKAERDISADITGTLAAHKSKNMAAITDLKEVGALLRVVESYKGSYITLCALKLAPLTFVRPGELRAAEWSEIDLEAKLWKIPVEKMKGKRLHIVPLSRQALEVFRSIKPLTGKGKYIFPSIKSSLRPMSENTVNGALRRLGYTKEEMTGHGFRTIASTLLHENQWPSHLIEMQLAHVENNKVKAAYNHAQYLKERVKMMQWWADFLDQLKAG